MDFVCHKIFIHLLEYQFAPGGKLMNITLCVTKSHYNFFAKMLKTKKSGQLMLETKKS